MNNCSYVCYGKVRLTGHIFTFHTMTYDKKYVYSVKGTIHRTNQILIWHPTKKEWGEDISFLSFKGDKDG